MKNVLITGASGNLGAATLKRFIDDGYRVIAIVTRGKGLGYEVSGQVELFECDLTDEKSSQAVVSEVISKFKTIDAALLLVGGYAAGGVESMDGTSLQKMISLNFETAFHVARPVFLQMLKQQRGRIVFIGARPAIEPKAGKGMMAYALSKSLLFKFSELLNAEGAGKNVVTSVVVPSTIDTKANREAMPKADFSSWVMPEEIAGVMAFLSSDPGASLRDPVIKIYGKA